VVEPVGSAAPETASAAEATAVRDEAPLDRSFLIRSSILGMVVTGLVCWLVHLLAFDGFYGKVADAVWVEPYWHDATSIAAGLLPYRDFAVEYPPFSLPPFLLPVVLPGGGVLYENYRWAFEVSMAACLIAIVPIVVWTVARLRGRRPDVWLAAAFVALSPLLLGPLLLSRYDIWPALLTAVATLAAVSGRHRVGFAVLALAALAKVYPIFLVPVFAAYAWRAAGRREALLAIGVGAVVGLVCLLPFVALNPAGAFDPFVRALARPLQVESLGASLLALLRNWLGLDIGHVTYTYFSFNLEGALPSLASTWQSVGLVVALLAIWALAIVRPAGDRGFVVASAAVVAIVVAFGKVLSPQYVIWLVPPIAVLTPIRFARPMLVLAIAFVLTQIYYPKLYLGYLIRFDAPATAAILERNLALLALAAYLVAVMWRLGARGSPRGSRRPDPPADRAPAGA
jgi:uncharacterized membrane protein